MRETPQHGDSSADEMNPFRTALWIFSTLGVATIAIGGWLSLSGYDQGWILATACAGIIFVATACSLVAHKFAVDAVGLVVGVMAAMAVRMPIALVAGLVAAPKLEPMYNGASPMGLIVALYMAALLGDVLGLVSEINRDAKPAESTALLPAKGQ